jgi:hypothetical protein
MLLSAWRGYAGDLEPTSLASQAAWLDHVAQDVLGRAGFMDRGAVHQR